MPLTMNPHYYEVSDSLLCYAIPVLDETGEVMKDEQGNNVFTFIPEGWNTDNQIHHLADLRVWLEDYFQKYFEWYNENNPDNPMTEPISVLETNFAWLPAGPEAFKNKPRTGTGTSYACYFLDRRELERADNTPYLNIKEVTGQSQTQTIYYKEQGKMFNGSYGVERYPSDTYSNVLYTIGVHQRGCGFVRFDDPEEYRSSYNYVDQVKKKIKDTTGKEVTADDIYSGKYDAEVQDAVEDLIIDECGLELAFEGTRFSDLYRVSMRRGNPDYLAERVAKRHTGEVDEKLRGWLNNVNHWFLPLPKE